VDLTHSFTVPASIDATWAAFLEVESVAQCFPGAAVTSVEGEEFTGTCKVKLGPISLVYSGVGRFVERDEAARRFVVEAKGKDKRGNGTANALVTARFTAAGADATEVQVVTDLAITGKPAQFGRGVMQDVSDKLLQQFVTCLEATVGAGSGESSREASPGKPTAGSESEGGEAVVAGHVRPRDVAATQAAGAAVLPGTTPATPPAVTMPASRTRRAPSGGTDAAAGGDDALDLSATVLPVLLRSYGKQVGLVLAVLAILARVLGRRRR
jgi:carbon monoxide dehydrogenase subunit G